MILVFYFILFVISLLVLVKSADLIVGVVLKIADFFRLPEFLTGFVLMGLTTTIPEFFTAMASAIAKAPNLSLGNAIGSNIVDTTLILGLAVLFSRSIQTKGILKSKDFIWLIFFSLIPLGIGFDGVISRIDGIILVSLYFLFIFLEFEKQKSERLKKHSPEGIFKNLLFFVILASLLLGSSWAMVESAIFIANYFSAPLILIGLILVAIGTSLPELAFMSEAALKKHPQVALGDFAGAFAANTSLILGIASLIYPIFISSQKHFMLSIVFLILAVIAFYYFCRTKEKLEWKEALFLILIYFVFSIFEFFV